MIGWLVKEVECPNRGRQGIMMLDPQLGSLVVASSLGAMVKKMPRGGDGERVEKSDERNANWGRMLRERMRTRRRQRTKIG